MKTNKTTTTTQGSTQQTNSGTQQDGAALVGDRITITIMEDETTSQQGEQQHDTEDDKDGSLFVLSVNNSSMRSVVSDISDRSGDFLILNARRPSSAPPGRTTRGGHLGSYTSPQMNHRAPLRPGRRRSPIRGTWTSLKNVATRKYNQRFSSKSHPRVDHPMSSR